MVQKARLNLLILCSLPLFAHADEWRVGAALGYGGAGITQTQTVKGSDTSVSKAEGPGMFNLYIERLMTDHWSLGLETEVGFRLGPFSAGESFNGVAGRYYIGGGQQGMVKPAGDSPTLFIRRWAMFVGAGMGVAIADISRGNDYVRNASGSGVYAAFKLGTDYPLSGILGMRIEITSGMTLMSQESPPSTLSMFALQGGIFRYF